MKLNLDHLSKLSGIEIKELRLGKLFSNPDNSKFVYLYRFEEMRMGYEIANLIWGTMLDGKMRIVQHPKSIYTFCSVDSPVIWLTNESFQFTAYIKRTDQPSVLCLCCIDYEQGMQLMLERKLGPPQTVRDDFIPFDEPQLINDAYALASQKSSSKW